MTILAAITPPDFGDGDLPALKILLATGRGPVHLRLPGRDADHHRTLLDALIPEELAGLVVHRHPGLLDEYPLAGVHLPWTRDPLPAPVDRCSLSAHQPDEVRAADPDLRCCFLSPVFPSISKPGHDRCLDRAELATLLAEGNRPPVLALGGVNPGCLEEVAGLGFDGVAVLGWLWSDREQGAVAGRYLELSLALDRAFPES